MVPSTRAQKSDGLLKGLFLCTRHHSGQNVHCAPPHLQIPIPETPTDGLYGLAIIILSHQRQERHRGSPDACVLVGKQMLQILVRLGQDYRDLCSALLQAILV
eukprot:CAMPEP_0180792874 /NCGR_PEP_ID=MMETSP1038_2-20121128/54668_1 /TAXON_ID=632150 /ORGANISM="Azadinium spinosum, Strain 3D9" /LENGTH=102 /DNA_ID=CAMNT_0022831295 /DNA_START=104 /DNA_END=409 /DNA_ORIENTATION=-